MKYLFMLLSYAFVLQVSSQDFNVSAGDLKSFKQNGQVLGIASSTGFYQVEVISPSIIHVRADQQKLEENFSYAIVGKAQKSSYTLVDSNSEIVITTDSLKTVISKKPLRISFYTIAGELINRDEPAFGITWTEHEVTNYKKIFDGERFIGLGEKTGPLDRRGNGYTNWNSDTPGYALDADPIYSSIPFYIGIHDSLCYGIFLDNSSKTHFNFGASNTRFSSFTAEVGELDYYFIYHSKVEDIIESYTFLTGRTPLPSKWSMGFQQCRWSYYPESEVMDLARTFREKEIPLDVIYLDIHFMDSYKIFTWNSDRFPDPARMVSGLRKMGIRTTLIVDPGIKVEAGYPAYESGLKQSIFLKYPDNTNYAGSVWPGLCHFPDFTNPASRKWWGDQFSAYTSVGVEGFWNDMNEPATWGQRFPSLVKFDLDGNGGSTLEGRNVYGMQMARATYEGAKLKMSGHRPFVLTRAGYAGLQRYTAIWTGDNVASDDHMLLGVRLVNSLGVSGVGNAGMDIGGFVGNASSELFARWISIGAFTPFFRSHKSINMKASEPWSYGEETEAIAKYYIRLRYKLMPYLYSTFSENALNGMPVARTLAIEHPFEAKVYDGAFQNQFMFGDALMVAPLSSTAMSAKVFLPHGEWFDFYSDQKFPGNKEIVVDAPLYRLPVFVKAGSIIPMQSVVQSAMEAPADTLMLHIYYGNEKNEFTYYEDDGETFDYEKGNSLTRSIIFDPLAKELIMKECEGSYASIFKYVKVIFHGFENASFILDGTVRSLLTTSYHPVFPDDIYRQELYYANQDVINAVYFVIPNGRGEMKISWK